MKDLIIRLDYKCLNWRDKCRQIYITWRGRQAWCRPCSPNHKRLRIVECDKRPFIEDSRRLRADKDEFITWQKGREIRTCEVKAGFVELRNILRIISRTGSSRDKKWRESRMCDYKSGSVELRNILRFTKLKSIRRIEGKLSVTLTSWWQCRISEFSVSRDDILEIRKILSHIWKNKWRI